MGPDVHESVVRVRWSVIQDAYGNDIRSVADELTIAGCIVLPPDGQTAASVEAVEARDQVVVLCVLFAPAGADIRAEDQIRHQGETYEVHGRPSALPGHLAHIEALLRVVTG
ncbi:hypothetical protein [Kitasatospora purpeofusca]|uniref:hypothetical protein n=1 Tax=Kitasatospora purpeofusca TaxID=67352 RepID=UPI0036D1BAB8